MNKRDEKEKYVKPKAKKIEYAAKASYMAFTNP